MLIIVCGLPGTGKTTISKFISKKYNAIHISSDVIRKEIFQKPEYTEEEKEKVYTRMLELVKAQLEDDRNVVVDATFYRKKQREQFLKLAASMKIETKIIVCDLPENVIKKRLDSRKNSKSDADYSVYLKLKKQFEPVTGEYLVIDMSLKERKSILTKFIGGKNE